MIVIKLIGGLGNQMFQYAMARALSLRHNCDLNIDISLLEKRESQNASGITLREYGLSAFNINCNIITNSIKCKTIKIRKENKFRRILLLTFCRLFSFVKPYFYERKDVRFDKSVLLLPDEIIIQGYFPSFKYFDDAKDQIKNEFQFKSEMDKKNKDILQKINSCNSVSIHIRRGDYILSQKTNSRFGTCSLDYYKNAVELIKKHVKNPEFFVFTNDVEYVKNNIKLDSDIMFVSHNTGDKSYEDMRLMSLCKHNIIANSSFSWWSAWLNKNPDKIVIAPTPAFDNVGLKDQDFYPDSWNLLEK